MNRKTGSNHRKFGLIHTAWIFGLGFGVGLYFGTDNFTNVIFGFIFALFLWFIGIIVILPIIHGLIKMINKKLG